MADRLDSSPEFAAKTLRELVEVLPDAIAVIDWSGRLVLANGQTEKLFGYHRDELLGQPIELFIPEWFQEKHTNRGDGPIVVPRPISMGVALEMVGLRKGGQEVNIEIHLNPLSSNGEQLIVAMMRDDCERRKAEEQRVVKMLGDVCERRKAEEQRMVRQTAELLQSNKALVEFATVVPYEIRSYLMTIQWLTERIAEACRETLDDATRKRMDRVIKAAKGLATLMDDLRNHCQTLIESKPLVSVECGRAWAMASEWLKEQIEKAAAKAVIVGELPTVRADLEQMAQLFHHLIGNSLKFRTVRPPEIHVSARREPAGWVIEVQDNGIGIQDGWCLQKIFKLGVTSKVHGQNQYPGSGVGLTTCERIVERFGGRIWASSEGLDKGTKISFALPATD